ncbi:MAG TPA: hypothetical protein IGS17_08255 [Oscillatoriales cyanobacterium M59_W2019_021]|nr:MAG: hypothetical protein D6728_03085 [Cyanobacteria bacterium J055]HIK33982.1 hypothetical protein [Oscillatoriales cyanobacterium M4454_W2019_049]HIK50899.1 hypothetical protein [Oscillatoriales cyanobacterium M59_W2019_021]
MSNFGWQARGWSTAAGFDVNANSYFKFTVDLTDYNNIQFALEERARDSGPTEFALAYQIGDGAISLHQTSPAKQDNPFEFRTFDLSGVAALQNLNAKAVRTRQMRRI